MDQRYLKPTPDDVKRRAAWSSASPDTQRRELERAHEEANMLNVPTFAERMESERDRATRDKLALALQVARVVSEHGGLALVVGGYARDEVLKKLGYDVASKDVDLEIYGIEPEPLKDLLSGLGSVDVVGEQFGVIKLKGLDIAIPRSDSKTGSGHRGFTVTGDPHMDIRDAMRRRDFTVNAMALNPLTGEIVDPHAGVNDIHMKTLRAVDAHTFPDDPLRALRAVQFAARFGFVLDPETERLCASMVRSEEFKNLPKERMGDEWLKLLEKSEKPSAGLEVARRLGIIERLHPELHALADVQQEQEWHPEGDVWTHTVLAVDAAARLVRGRSLTDEQRRAVLLATLCHDFGKPATTTTNQRGQIISHEHAQAGIEPSRSFLRSLRVSRAVVDMVTPLVREHLWPAVTENPSDAAIRRLARRLEPANIEMLALVCMADNQGRGYQNREDQDTDSHAEREAFEQKQRSSHGRILAFVERAHALSIAEQKPEPIVRGRHLLELGVAPSRRMGLILEALQQAQDEGVFNDLEGGIRWYKQNEKKLGRQDSEADL